MRKLPASLSVAATVFFVGLIQDAAAFPRTKEKADLSISFSLVGTQAAPSATGTATVDVTRSNGVETDSDLTITVTGLTDGTYNVDAVLKNDETATPVPIGTITVAGQTPIAPLALPAGLDVTEIATLTVSSPADPNVLGSVATVLLTGTPTEDIASWTFFANRPVKAPENSTPVETTKHGKKPKKIHGHVLIQAKIVDNVEKREKFLLVAHGGPADTELTIKLDGVVAGTFTTTKNGKMMVKSLTEDVRLAGVHLMTITDASDNVIAEADFFPSID